MTKRKVGTSDPVDLRSTGRKRARRVLFKEVDVGNRTFACECNRECVHHLGSVCGYTPTGELNRSNNLDVNHINKNLADVDPANLEFLCRKCHLNADRATAKGVSAIKDEFGYGLEDLGIEF